MIKSYGLRVDKDLHKEVLDACSENALVNLKWAVHCKDAGKHVTPVGAVLQLTKQIVIPIGGEVRLV